MKEEGRIAETGCQEVARLSSTEERFLNQNPAKGATQICMYDVELSLVHGVWHRTKKALQKSESNIPQV